MASEPAPTGRTPGRPAFQLDAAAERALRRRLGDRSRSFRGVSAQDFDDVYQDAWVKLLKGERNGKRMRSLEGLLDWGVAKSWLEELRKRRRRPAVCLDAVSEAALVADGADPARQAELLETARCLFEWTGAVTERQRQIFLLADVVGLSSREIQQRLGISKRLYEKEHARAGRAMRASLADLLASGWCDQYREALGAHAAGRASPSQDREARRHLDNCPACTRTLAVRRAAGAPPA